MAYIGKAPGVGIRNRFIFTATAGQTVFSGVDDYNLTLSYTDAQFTDVFLNGVKLDKTDYTATSGTSIVLAEAAALNDTLEVLAFDTFSVFSGEFSQDVTVGGTITTDGLIVDTNTLYVDSTNNRVGIGTSSPSSIGGSSKLVVNQGADGNSVFVRGGGTRQVQLGTTSTTGYINTDNTSGLTLDVNGSERMRIDSSGNVGIGTSSPQGRLEINGGTGVGTSGGTLIVRQDGDANTDGIALTSSNAISHRIWKDSSGKLNIGPSSLPSALVQDLSGNIGIGTSFPIYALHIEKSNTSGNVDFLIRNSGTTSSSNTRILSFVSGASGGDPSIGVGITGVQDYFWRIDNDDSDKLKLDSNGTTRMTIDSSGNVGISTGASSAAVHGYTQLEIESSSHSALQFSGSTGAEQWIWFADDASSTPVGGITYYHGGPYMGFRVEGSERMRIDSSGRLLVNGTSNLYGQSIMQVTSGSNTWTTMRNIDQGSAQQYTMVFARSSSNVGAISTTNTSTIFTTTSDYRLKENVTGITDGIERVKQLAPSRFNFIADADSTVDGFLAHEVQGVVPEAATGEKDAMRDEEYEVTPAVLDDDGNVVTEAVMGTRSVPDYQGIDQAKLVPLLTAALQEAITKIETLETQNADFETRLAALEAN